MVLLKRRFGLSYFARRAVGATCVALPAYLVFAEYKSRQVDQEFLYVPSQREDGVPTDGRTAEQRARSRLDQIIASGTDEYGVAFSRRPPTLPRTQAPAIPLEEAKPVGFGDIALFMGTGGTSWMITRLGYLFTGLNTDALRYSHVGMVVGPLPDECCRCLDALKSKAGASTSSGASFSWWRSKSSTASGGAAAASMTPMLDAIRRASADGTVLVIEAIDNKDCNAPNVLPAPNAVAHDQVMVTPLALRAFGVDYREREPRWCYNRLALRHLASQTWDEATVMRVERWLQGSLGRPMDKSKTLPLAMVEPRLHRRATPDTISCSELVAEGLIALGVIPEVSASRWREAGGGQHLPPIMYAPVHFTTLGEQWCGWEYLPIDRFGAEQRISMRKTQTTPPPMSPSQLAREVATGHQNAAASCEK